MGGDIGNPAAATAEYSDDNDGSCCSTPFVSAPSIPGRDTNTTPFPNPGFYFSAPASPVHFVFSKPINSINSYPSSATDANASFDFDFSASLTPTAAPPPESMSSADELFLNGQIRPMKLSTHLRRPQLLAPLIEPDDDVVEEKSAYIGSRQGAEEVSGRVTEPEDQIYVSI
ncbi:hypothetical protein CASFOL_018704 [Castilleja foliolosa]|uniref:Uncharacterized protein n=1 Tax=Castilleja foliolosa TaxID=1961234 RepID=A0ABD3D5H2_9LAMI